ISVTDIARIVRSEGHHNLVLVIGPDSSGVFNPVGPTVPTRRTNQCLDRHRRALGENLFPVCVIPIGADPHAHIMDRLLLDKRKHVVDPSTWLLAPEPIVRITHPVVAHSSRWKPFVR